MNDDKLPQIEDDQDDVAGHRIKNLGEDSGMPRNAADSRTGGPPEKDDVEGHRNVSLVDDDDDDVEGHVWRPGGDIPPTGMDK